MAPEDQQRQPNQNDQVAAELAALSARVESLERQLAELRGASPQVPRRPVAPPPRPVAAVTTPEPVQADLGKAIRKDAASLEDRIGSQLFSRIGIVALLVAITLFLKWAIDNHWIGQTGRIAAGLVGGAALVLWSERFRRKGFSAFSYSLKAVGSGALYLSLWAAFQLYHLLPAEVAFGAMVLVTAWNAYMSWVQNSQILAVYALAGAFATPLLLATGSNHEVFLFSYVLAIDIAAVVLVRLKNWPRLLLGAFPATVAYFIGWYAEYYGAFNVGKPLAITTVFIVLFFVVFLFPTIGQRKESGSWTPITEVFLPLADATFVALALYSVLQDSGQHDLLPWVAVLLGAIYLGLMRLPQSRATSAVHLSLAVVFLTIAIPLKASGRWITIGWLAEGVALLWISARLSAPSQQPALATIPRTLQRLGVGALTLGFLGLMIDPFWLNYRIDTAFLNSRFAGSLFGVAAFAASAWIANQARRNDDTASPHWEQISAACIIALNLVAVLGVVRELDAAWRYSAGNPEAELQKSLAVSAFLMLYGAGLLAIGFWKRSAFVRWQALILLVFTIGKTFLYDTRNLSQGYRALSFLGLGVLLMAVSFAYQKDWLALRATAMGGATTGNSDSQEGADR